MSRFSVRRPGDAPIGFKPHPWAIQRRLLHPRAQKFWDGLVAGFPMWEGSGNVHAIGPKANLFPSNTLDGGAVWTRDERGPAVDTSSTTAGTGIACGTADPIPEDSFTLVFAGRLDVLPGAGDFTAFLAKRTSGDIRWQWVIQSAGNSNTLTLSGAQTVDFTVVPSLGYHIWAVSHDGTNSKIYEDGILLESTDETFAFGAFPSADVNIGREKPGGTENFDGVIDFALMYECVLSELENRQLVDLL